MSENFDRIQLRSVHLVPLTPFDAADNLNTDLLAEHIARMYAAGMRVFLPAAGTSEFHSLSADEVVECVRITREASGADAVVFAPVGLQVGHAIEIAVRSREVGATGVMFMPWVHPYLSDDGVRRYVRAVLDEADCPALIYKKASVPSGELLLELADDPRIVGVKHAVSEMHEFRKLILADRAGGTGWSELPLDAANTGSSASSGHRPKVGQAAMERRLEWLCGTAERFAPYYMLAGASGFTTGAGNLCPHLSLAIHAAFQAGEYPEGMRLQETILPIEDFRARAGDSYNVSMLKYAMSLLGHDFGPPRPPQRTITEQDRTEIECLMKPILAIESQLQSELASVGLSKP